MPHSNEAFIIIRNNLNEMSEEEGGQWIDNNGPKTVDQLKAEALAEDPPGTA